MFLCCKAAVPEGSDVEINSWSPEVDTKGPESQPAFVPQPACTPPPAPAPEAEPVSGPAPAAVVAPVAEQPSDLSVPKAWKEGNTFSVPLDPQVAVDVGEDSWNHVVVIKASSSSGLQHGDRITKAGGESNTKAILDKLREGKSIDIEVQRPPEFEISLKRELDQKLGAVIAQSGKVSLLVKELKAGVFQDYNEKNPKMQVVPGDRIISVNLKKDNSDDIFKEITSAMTLNVVIRKGSF